MPERVTHRAFDLPGDRKNCYQCIFMCKKRRLVLYLEELSTEFLKIIFTNTKIREEIGEEGLFICLLQTNTEKKK